MENPKLDVELDTLPQTPFSAVVQPEYHAHDFIPLVFTSTPPYPTEASVPKPIPMPMPMSMPAHATFSIPEDTQNDLKPTNNASCASSIASSGKPARPDKTRKSGSNAAQCIILIVVAVIIIIMVVCGVTLPTFHHVRRRLQFVDD